jgi:hypothetical protein
MNTNINYSNDHIYWEDSWNYTSEGVECTDSETIIPDKI